MSIYQEKYLKYKTKYKNLILIGGYNIDDISVEQITSMKIIPAGASRAELYEITYKQQK